MSGKLRFGMARIWWRNFSPRCTRGRFLITRSRMKVRPRLRTWSKCRFMARRGWRGHGIRDGVRLAIIVADWWGRQFWRQAGILSQAAEKVFRQAEASVPPVCNCLMRCGGGRRFRLPVKAFGDFFRSLLEAALKGRLPSKLPAPPAIRLARLGYHAGTGRPIFEARRMPRTHSADRCILPGDYGIPSPQGGAGAIARAEERGGLGRRRSRQCAISNSVGGGTAAHRRA